MEDSEYNILDIILIGLLIYIIIQLLFNSNEHMNHKKNVAEIDIEGDIAIDNDVQDLSIDDASSKSEEVISDDLNIPEEEEMLPPTDIPMDEDILEEQITVEDEQSDMDPLEEQEEILPYEDISEESSYDLVKPIMTPSDFDDTLEETVEDETDDVEEILETPDMELDSPVDQELAPILEEVKEEEMEKDKKPCPINDHDKFIKNMILPYKENKDKKVVGYDIDDQIDFNYKSLNNTTKEPKYVNNDVVKCSGKNIKDVYDDLTKNTVDSNISGNTLNNNEEERVMNGGEFYDDVVGFDNKNKFAMFKNN